MTFTDATFAEDGDTITGQLYRLQLHSATYGGKGIIEPLDLEVRELETPGTSVRILSGGCVIAGDAVAFLGSWFGYNVGSEQMPIASTGSGETRSDMIIVQAQSPSYAGSPFDRDPATDRIVVPVVVPNVSPTATTTSEVNAIALARIDMPASTGTVTQDLITDLRRPLILTPVFQDSIQHGSGVEPVGSGTTFTEWPGSAATVDVPSWATRMDIDVEVRTIRLNRNGGVSPNNMFGNTRIAINGTAVGQTSAYNQEWSAGIDRVPLGHAQTYDATPFAGTRVTATLEINVAGKSDNEIIEADSGTSVIWRVFFRQEPAFNPS